MSPRSCEPIERGAPVDLVFQSIAGTEAANTQLRHQPRAARRSRTTRRTALEPRHGRTQRRCTSRPARAARSPPTRITASTSRRSKPAPTPSPARYQPLLVNTVVGFIGPEYLYDGKQILRAGLEDHFCGKLLGLPMGCDVCYTNHAEADQDDMDALLTLLGAAGVNYIMGVPGADDIMLNYQSTSFHDALYLRAAARPPPGAGVRGVARQRKMLAGPAPAGSARRRAAAARLQALLRRRVTRLGRPAPAHRRPHRPRPRRRLLATRPLLDFRLAHARARDAVHAELDEAALLAALPRPGRDRPQPGRRPPRLPDAPRPRPRPRSRTARPGCQAERRDLAVVIADGLSAAACATPRPPVLDRLLPRSRPGRLAPPGRRPPRARCAWRPGGRGARGRAVLVLIGERPGLSAPDSLGAYLTWAPGPATTDAGRNCVSNIRPEGLGYDDAAFRLAFLLDRMRSLRMSGVALKDESEAALLTPLG